MYNCIEINSKLDPTKITSTHRAVQLINFTDDM